MKNKAMIQLVKIKIFSTNLQIEVLYIFAEKVLKELTLR